jgi:hypothetical protein
MAARFLGEQDRLKAVERIRENKTGVKNNVWKMAQAVEATLDIKIWLLVIIQLSTNVANGGVQSVSLSSNILMDAMIADRNRPVLIDRDKRIWIPDPHDPTRSDDLDRVPTHLRRHVLRWLNVLQEQ